MPQRSVMWSLSEAAEWNETRCKPSDHEALLSEHLDSLPMRLDSYVQMRDTAVRAGVEPPPIPAALEFEPVDVWQFDGELLSKKLAGLPRDASGRYRRADVKARLSRDPGRPRTTDEVAARRVEALADLILRFYPVSLEKVAAYDRHELRRKRPGTMSSPAKKSKGFMTAFRSAIELAKTDAFLRRYELRFTVEEGRARVARWERYLQNPRQFKR